MSELPYWNKFLQLVYADFEHKICLSTQNGHTLHSDLDCLELVLLEEIIVSMGFDCVLIG